jgi:serine/threonine protein kinase
MTPERWSQVRELLAQCLEVEDSQLAPLLQSVDAGLRQEVESLLAAAGRESFLETAPFLPASVSPLTPGSPIGRYTIRRLIGEGGMGTVFEAIDSTDHSRVAIKVLNGTAGLDPDLPRRFLREARLVSRLSHPNIVQIRDFLEIETRAAIVMEFVEGKTLAEQIPTSGLPIPEAAAIASQIAAAIACAHQAGIVHRDLKPANVIVPPSGPLKVLDFGAAKLLPGSAGTDRFTSTGSGVLLGSPAYMSPEQARGAILGTPTDIFSFGSLLYLMFTGVKPFERRTLLATLSAVIRDQPRRPSAIRLGIPRSIDSLILRCLDKNPQQRPSIRQIEDVFKSTLRHKQTLFRRLFAAIKPKLALRE